jgi:ABC-type Fe3+ transport system substrate-binding protein
VKWFDALLANNPLWFRGTATPSTLVGATNSSSVATFTSSHSFSPSGPIDQTLPTEGTFVSWAQTGAILKDAPHPEGAKLLHNFILSDEWQKNLGWSVRQDIAAPAGAEKILEQSNTNAPAFAEWMADRANVERLRFFFEERIGTAQGLSPLEDDM